MTMVVTGFSMSLDGFIAYPDDSVGPLFDWYSNGDVEVVPPGYPLKFTMTEPSARYWHDFTDNAGAMVAGRRIFDYTKGWGGNPPLGLPTFVVTHRPPPEDWPPRPDAPFTFVHDGVESAVAQAKAVAGEKVVSVAGANIAQQCLRAGLLDVVAIELVPVILGSGVRYFDHLEGTDITFSDPQVYQGKRVTHLVYQVKR
jgi:dihydrofolate reductase